MAKLKLVRIGDAIFNLSRVVYVCLDFDFNGGIALEFSTMQSQHPSYIPPGKLNGIDRRRLRKFRFFAGDAAQALTEIFQEQAVTLDQPNGRLIPA